MHTQNLHSEMLQRCLQEGRKTKMGSVLIPINKMKNYNQSDMYDWTL